MRYLGIEVDDALEIRDLIFARPLAYGRDVKRVLLSMTCHSQ